MNDQVRLVGIASRSHAAGCFGTDEEQTSHAAVATRADTLAAWVNETVSAPPVVDFNGDGAQDTAVADPRATVGGNAEAGLVRVVYGRGGGTQQVDQDMATVPGGAEPGDRFGESLATVDYNLDGYTDLVVGIPYEDLAGEKDAGMVTVLFGSREGVAKQGEAPFAHFEQGTGDGVIGGSASEAGDLMGFALAAGTNRAGEPYLYITLPGEDLGSVKDAGSSVFVRRGGNVGLNQGSGMPGAREAGDRVGFSADGDSNHIAVGLPYEDVGNSSGANAADAGAVYLLDVNDIGPDGRPRLVADISQEAAGVSGGAETGDNFGAALSTVNTDPAAVSGPATMRLAVGVPGEAWESVSGAGAVQTFSLLGAPGDSDAWVAPGNVGLPGAPAAGERFGRSLTAAPQGLYPGRPDGPSPFGQVHVLPWANVTAGQENRPVTTFEPGSGGLPAAGSAFGFVIR
ncbi:FG-GAP repeat protein [Streptomyces sp. TRM 70361]|uniref:FG-GAP and VCBS repeat-containing protein n=1 Tax=Streptomyces sp. TRM 70361 TaxID=3116553 RepID=UPI002E7B68E1|nr:FG-GAP repeat protein [Streptomyces sp. TRM 70361]MEE1941833.1 FG-GAP repeat protein [Streptomyces sp. TRM 70361]